MDGLEVDFEALEQCRIEVAGQPGPMASAADGLPAGVSADSFGGLDGAGALADAVNALAGTVGGEIEQASARLEQVGGALQAVIDSVRETEQNNAQSLTPAG
jgi:hypothetical protein